MAFRPKYYPHYSLLFLLYTIYITLYPLLFTLILILHLYQFYIKYEGGVGENDTGTLRAVCKVIRYVETIFTTFLHQLHTLYPSINQLIKDELCWCSTIIA